VRASTPEAAGPLTCLSVGRAPQSGSARHFARALTRPIIRCYRFAFYRIARDDLNWATEVVGRTELPPFVTNTARTRWPAATGEYVGFRAQEKAKRARHE
jgi:hypothetical protein